MSFYAKLSIEERESVVLSCRFRFSQDTDEIGKPSSITQGGKIFLTIESSNHIDLYDWVISPTMMKSGAVTFYKRDAMSKLKVLTFTDAYCVDYNEKYTHDGEYPMTIDIEISAKKLSLNDSDFENQWSN